MRKDKTMTLNEHLQNAKDLAIAAHHLRALWKRCEEHYPKSHSLMKVLDKFHPSLMSGWFIQLKSDLDREYHNVITDEQFKEFGHIYYNLKTRYAKCQTTPK